MNGNKVVISVRFIVGANEPLCRNSWWTKVHRLSLSGRGMSIV